MTSARLGGQGGQQGPPAPPGPDPGAAAPLLVDQPPGQGGPTWQHGPGGWQQGLGVGHAPPGLAAPAGQAPAGAGDPSRFAALPKGMDRAASEIYAGMLRCGTSARDWLMLSGTLRTAQWQWLWALVTQLDSG